MSKEQFKRDIEENIIHVDCREDFPVAHLNKLLKKFPGGILFEVDTRSDFSMYVYATDLNGAFSILNMVADLNGYVNNFTLKDIKEPK